MNFRVLKNLSLHEGEGIRLDIRRFILWNAIKHSHTAPSINGVKPESQFFFHVVKAKIDGDSLFKFVDFIKSQIPFIGASYPKLVVTNTSDNPQNPIGQSDFGTAILP
ncbi:MAG: hypothetical protein IPN06_09255 [Burkholderiales bacterium]|nr:hypothetical protein [Burkholderiales bacterium]